MTDAQPINPASEEATTGSLVAQPHWWRPPLQERKPRLKEADLHKREHLMIAYMVHGIDHPTLAPRVKRDPPPKLGEPLTLTEAASLCRIKPRHARWLSTQPAFQRALSRETLAFREGAKARAWRKVDELAHTPGDGSAAWAKVNHQAASTIIGEPKQTGPTINVQTNVGLNVKAGLVLRLPADAPAIPLEEADEE